MLQNYDTEIRRNRSIEYLVSHTLADSGWRATQAVSEPVLQGVACNELQRTVDCGNKNILCKAVYSIERNIEQAACIILYNYMKKTISGTKVMEELLLTFHSLLIHHIIRMTATKKT